MSDKRLEEVLLLQPDLKIQVRGPLEPGLSGAQVLLVDFEQSGQRRLGVLKITTFDKVQREAAGDRRARETWLKRYLPDFFIPLTGSPGGNAGILMPLAKDRLENCETLHAALNNAFRYARMFVLPNLIEIYCKEAVKCWSSAILRPLREGFTKCVNHELPEDWQQNWLQNGFPPPEAAAFVLDDFSSRLPNPVAYFVHQDLWPKDKEFGVTAPWITSHGDLNCRNVLCPSAERSVSLCITTGSEADLLKLGLAMQSYISFIDTPFCREAPFTFDPSFIGIWLDFLLPSFDSRTGRDIVLRSFQAVLDQIRTEREPINVPAAGAKFVECFGVIPQRLLGAQRLLPDDIKKSFLSTLSAAALWMALRVGSSQNLELRRRLDTVRLLCFSAMALRELLGDRVILGPAAKDFFLETMPGRSPARPWTSAASGLGELFSSSKGRRNLILVLGRGWNEACGLNADQEADKVSGMAPEEAVRLAKRQPREEVVNSMKALGRLPLAAICDWGVFPTSRQILSAGLPAPSYVRPVIPGQNEPAWTEHDAIFYFQMRGSLEVLPSLALRGPARNQSRAKLRGPLARFRDHRAGDFVILYVGIDLGDLRETHPFLEEFWGDKPKCYFVGRRDPCELASFLDEWGISTIEGSIDDFLTVVEDLPEPEAISGPLAQRRLLRVADMARSEDGDLIAKPGEILDVEVPEEDFEAICRAGDLLLEGDRSSLTTLTRDPKEFFVGHPIEFSELHAGIAVERKVFEAYFGEVKKALQLRHLQSVSIVSRPGAGASTVLRWLAYNLAFEQRVPTLMLSTAGATGFEAIERLYRLVGRSFIIVADPQDVPSDELGSLTHRCAPARYPVVFLTSLRALRTKSTASRPVLDIQLEPSEKVEFLQRLARYCPSVPLQRLMNSGTRSLFLLSLEAFGEDNVRVDKYVSGLLSEASPEQSFLLAAIALFSRYAHRSCSLEFLQIISNRSLRVIEEDLEQFNQLLVLRERDIWVCRHDQLSKAILQFYLTKAFTDQYRYELAGFVCRILTVVSESGIGKEVAADFVWAILNPQVEAEAGAGGERQQQSRFINSEDGVPTPANRYQVFHKACQVFPTHVLIISHFGKYLSEEEGKFTEADDYLLRAYELEPGNEAVPHMIGKRFFDELREVLNRNPARDRAEAVQEEIYALAKQAQDWFAKSRERNLSSEFGYTTAIQINIRLIRDELQRMGLRTAVDNPQAVTSDRVVALLSEADSLVADGQRYIEPREETRRVFNQARDTLHQLRGDLNTAIQCFRQHVLAARGVSRVIAQVQLARLLHERGEVNLIHGERGKANKDFKEGADELFDALSDPGLKYRNIKLWFDCARNLPNWNRADFLGRLHQLHDFDPASLDAIFLLMCLYFCEAIETASLESWRRYEEYQRKSSTRSANLAIRRYVREWLVKASVTGRQKSGEEYRIFPHHYFDASKPRERGAAKPEEGPRVRVTGVVERVESSTEGYLAIPPMAFQLYFRPRAGDRPFYKSDAERKTRVSFLVAFTYEKAEAFDVERI